MSENNPVEMSDSQWEDSIREAQIDVPRNYTTRKYRNFMFDLKATIIARMANSGGAFDLHDDVTTEETTPQDNDRLAVSAEDETGDPMRWLSLSPAGQLRQGQDRQRHHRRRRPDERGGQDQVGRGSVGSRR